MTEEITITLAKKKFAPWGLFTESDSPQALVWLADENDKSTIDYRLLTSTDVERIHRAERAGIITVEGLEKDTPSVDTANGSKGNLQVDPELAQQVLDMAALIQGSEPIKYEDIPQIQPPTVSPREEILDFDPEIADPEELLPQQPMITAEDSSEVTEDDLVQNIKADIKSDQQAQDAFFRQIKDIQAQTLQKEFLGKKEEEEAIKKANIKEKYEALLEKRENNPFVLETLDQPAPKVRKALKILGRGRISIDFFKVMMKKEQEGKNRKTIVKAIRKIIEEKVSRIDTEVTVPGTGSLEQQYEDLIEEEEGTIEVVHDEDIEN